MHKLNGTTLVHHINCGSLHVPPGPKAICHCLLLQDDTGLSLVDTGIGLLDVQAPVERIGQALIDVAGFIFREEDTAVRQIERLGLNPGDVRQIFLTHADPDHTGGLADFPQAEVHVAEEELASVTRGHWRYLPSHFAHGPRWKPWTASSRSWFGLEGRPVEAGLASEVLFIPLFGHTLGHCGVAIRQGEQWVLHAGDAYYLRVETERDDHPVSRLTEQRADDDATRRESLEQVRRLLRDHGDEITLFGYHDSAEFPADAQNSV